MSVGPLVVGRQSRIMRRFEEAGAAAFRAERRRILLVTMAVVAGLIITLVLSR